MSEQIALQPASAEAPVVEIPEPTQEVLQFNDGQLGLRLDGAPGAAFDWDKHKYGPGDSRGEALVQTASGNQYFIETHPGGVTDVYNLDATKAAGRLVGESKEAGIPLPPVEFHSPWRAGSMVTTPVEAILLRYKTVSPDSEAGHKVDAVSPFAQAKELLAQYGYSEEPER